MLRRADQVFCGAECRSRAHYLLNGDRIRARSAEWSKGHRERIRSRYHESPDKFRARTAAWRNGNRERHRAYTREFYKRNPETVRRRQLAKYGLTPNAYDGLLAAQCNACAICGTTTPSKRRKYFDVDHCHSTLRVRGLLCEVCNRVVGLFGDEPKRFLHAARYLTETTHAVDPQ